MRRRRLQAPHGTVTIERVAGGVARVRAGHWLDAWYALGWLHGRDRGAQLALARVAGQGRICELLRDDDDVLEVDRYFRRFGLAQVSSGVQGPKGPPWQFDSWERPAGAAKIA